MESAFICPFTKDPLELLSEADLSLLNKKIEAEQLFFQQGVPIDFKVNKAYVSANRVYVYPVMEDILMLQKQMAIVDRNQTAHPTRRIREADVVTFHKTMGFGLDGKFVKRDATNVAEPVLTPDTLEYLYRRLDQQGGTLVTMATRHVEWLRQLVLALDYQEHIHLDDDPDRLRSVVGQLSPQTKYVLCDSSYFPLRKHCIDGFFGFSYQHFDSKTAQQECYESLKLALNPEKHHVCLVDKSMKKGLQAAYNADLIASRFKLWKKTPLPRIHFEALVCE